MNPYQTIPSALLNNAGLNCHAVFEIASLPAAALEILDERCPQARQYSQLILIGHGGKVFWEALKATGVDLSRQEEQHPVDNFTVSTVQQFMHEEHADCAYQIIYPGTYTISLQELGKLAGWHHSSPFMVGINPTFGSWFAYRAVVLANTNLALSAPIICASPCDSCEDKPCISACPAQALDAGEFHLLKCVSYRQEEASVCKNTCVARRRCPVAIEHRYSEEQMQYHYGRSMRVIGIDSQGSKPTKSPTTSQTFLAAR